MDGGADRIEGEITGEFAEGKDDESDGERDRRELDVDRDGREEHKADQ